MKPKTFPTLKEAIFLKLLIQALRLANKAANTKQLIMLSINEEPLTVAEIGRLLGNSRQSTLRAATQLIEEGLCEFKKTSFYQKSKLLMLTPKGQKAVSRSADDFEKMVIARAHGMSNEKLAEVASVLESLNG